MRPQIKNRTEILEFSPVTDEVMPLLVRKFRDFKSRSCDYSVGGVLLWSRMFDYSYTIYENSLLLKGKDPETGNLLYYKPIGDLSLQNAISLYRQDAAGRESYLVDYIEDENIEEAEPVAGERKNPCIRRREWDEYVYPIEKFVGFPGKKMEKKRNHLNYFNNHYPDKEIIEITSENASDIAEFSAELDALHPDESGFEYENSECIRMLGHIEETPMFGIAVKIEGKIVGYAFGEVVGDTLFQHAEKGNYNIRGIYQFLASEMAARGVLLGATFVNREDDMCSEDLRKSKLSYHPSMMIRKMLFPI